MGKIPILTNIFQGGWNHRLVVSFGGEGIEGHGRLDSWREVLNMFTNNDQDGLRMTFVVVPSGWSDINDFELTQKVSYINMLQNMILNLLDFVKDPSPR